MRDEIHQKGHKKEHNFSHKRAKDCCIQILLYTSKIQKNNFFTSKGSPLKRKVI